MYIYIFFFLTFIFVSCIFVRPFIRENDERTLEGGVGEVPIANGWCICERDSYRLISRRSIVESIELFVSQKLLATWLDGEPDCLCERIMHRL